MRIPLWPVLLTASVTVFSPLDATSPPAGDDPKPDPALKALAGRYGRGAWKGSKHTLILKADGTFTLYRGTSCFPGVEVNKGTAKLVDGHLLLTPQRLFEPGESGAMATDYVPLTWGKRKPRRYLVPNGAGRDFCNLVNEGWEPRKVARGACYLRSGDWDIDVDGPPDIPKEWRQWLAPASTDEVSAPR
jgi:hypothetical protein